MPITDFKLITPATIARPGYWVPVAEAGFGTTLTRICGNTGSLITAGALGIGLSDKWHSDARHHYSRDNPWNCDGTLADIEQKGGTPSKMILSARPGPEQWKVLKGNTGNFRSCGDSRWHPSKPTVMVGYNKSTRELLMFDVLTNAVLKHIFIPFTFLSSNGGFMGEGSLSNDASVVALGDEANNVIMVDITSGRVSPVQKVAFIRSAGALGNITVSPLSTPAGGYVVAKMSNKPELVHVYKYGADLILKHHFESNLTMSHGDVGLTLDGRECFVGDARDWYGSGSFTENDGSVVAIFLDSGELRNVSAGPNQLGGKKVASAQHCSCRGPAGWVLATNVGPQESTALFSMELIAWPLDGSKVPIRFGVTRTNETGIYRAEAHGVMRPGLTPTAVMFASNNQWATSARGPTTDIKSFVYELGAAIEPPIDLPPPASAKPYAIAKLNVDYAIVDSRGALVPPSELVRWGNER